MTKKPSIISKIVELDGRKIHLLAMSDGTVVSNKSLQDYALSLTVKKNRSTEAGKEMAEQKKRLKVADTPFKVPQHLYKEFAFDLVTGVDFCARKYGATHEQIKSEAKRIAPHINL